jgi:hypothetical protein
VISDAFNNKSVHFVGVIIQRNCLYFEYKINRLVKLVRVKYWSTYQARYRERIQNFCRGRMVTDSSSKNNTQRRKIQSIERVL